MTRISILAAGLLLAFASTSSFAADGNAGFVRAEVGNANVSIDGEDDNDTAYGLRGGYFFNANIGVEGFYTNLYDETVRDEFFGDITLEGRTYGIGMVAKKNLGEAHTGLFVSGRLGVARTEMEIGVAGFGSEEESDTRVFLGAGAGYDFNEHFGLSVDVNYQQPKLLGETFKVTTVTVAAEYRF